jgi:DNA helicase-2/ATP-dependent DNA helicase PcrA
VEGLLPKQPDSDLPRAEQIANIEEQRRLFYVGISRVKALPDEGKPGTLILTYSQKMQLADAMAAGIKPASVTYGIATLHASSFIREMKPAAPAPIAG